MGLSSRGILGCLVLALLTGCMASQPHQLTSVQPATDRFLSAGDVLVAQEHLRTFGFDPGPINGRFTLETQAAIQAFQTQYSLPVSGLLDARTRIELLPGLDMEENDPD